MGLTSDQLSKIISQAKTGKQVAFKSLLDEYWSYVYGFQMSRTKDEYVSEDITIQTFAKAFDKIESFNPNYNFKTWLISISKNLHVDMIRKESHSVITSTSKAQEKTIQHLADHNLTAEDELIRQQNLSLLLNTIKLLKPHYQEIINLRYFQELSYKEIAEALNEPMNNIKVKLLRAKKLLAELIKKQNL